MSHASSAIYFTENQIPKVFDSLVQFYRQGLKVIRTSEQLNQLTQLNKQLRSDYFFHSDDKIIPQVKAIGNKANIYFYKNNNQAASISFENIDNLSSFDLVYTESLEDLKQFLHLANPILIKLASESKYVPLVRILFNHDGIRAMTRRISLELPLKEYIEEALPIFKTKTITIEPRENSDKVAVIVESAVHSALELVVRNVMFYLGSGWSLIIYHSQENEFFVKNALKDLSNIEYRLPYFPIYSVSEYNRFMKMAEFYRSLNAKKVLIFQTDSIMLRGGIDRFLAYDWVGAPWPHHRAVGNGGFSLRTVSVMIEACINVCNESNINVAEDLVFSGYVQQHHNMISYKEAYSFSLENPVKDLGYMTFGAGILDAHMAVHQAWLLNNHFTVKRILRYSLNQIKHE